MKMIIMMMLTRTMIIINGIEKGYLFAYFLIHTIQHLSIYWLFSLSLSGFARPTDVFGSINNVGVINNISFYLSQSLIQTNEIKEELFCDETAQSCSSTNICFCLHRIKVKLNSIVEIKMKDDSRGEEIYLNLIWVKMWKTLHIL